MRINMLAGYMVGTFLALCVPLSFIYAGDFEHGIALCGLRWMVMLFLLFIGFQITRDALVRKSMRLYALLFLATSVTVVFGSFIFQDELVYLRDARFFAHYREDFDALVYFAEQSACSESPDGCRAVELPSGVQAWLGSESMLVAHDQTGAEVTAIAVRNPRGGDQYMFFKDIQALPYTHFTDENQGQFYTRLYHYAVNCYYQLNPHWYICTMVYS